MKIKSMNNFIMFEDNSDNIKDCIINAVKTDTYLSGVDLSGADLSGVDLSGVDLSRADLSRADLSGASLSGADLSRADLSGVDLSGADLSRADLRGVDLSGASLRGASLRGAKIKDDVEIQKIPIQTMTPLYDIIIFDNHIKIGCQFHSIDEWFNFDNREILEMDGKEALVWWNKWKEPLIQICKAEGRDGKTTTKKS